MRRFQATVSALLLGLAITTGSAISFAQTASQAKRFAAAQKLYDTGAFTPAYEEFKALAAETGSPNAEVYVARCLRELGRLPEAYEAMAVALRDATAKAESEPKYAATRNAAAADLALLEPKIAKLVIAIANPPAGMMVTLGGAPLPNEKLGLPVVTATGEAVVRIHAPGRDEIERRVTLRGGETSTLTVALDAGPSADATKSSGASSSMGGARVAGIVTLGVGVAGMVTFAAAGLMANSRYDSVKTACGGVRCTDPSFTDQIAGGRRLDIIADVGLGVGIAGLVGGALLVAFGGPKSAEREPAPVSAWIAPSGGGLVVRGSY